MTSRPHSVALVGSSLGKLLPRAMALFIGVDLAIFMRYAIKDWPRPWLHILGENNTVTWLSSMQLSLIGWLAIALGLVMGLQRATKSLLWQRLGWVGFGTAFLALSADETLQFHERLQFGFTLPGFYEGDGMLLAVAVVGVLVAGGVLLPQLQASRAALGLFVGSGSLAVLSQVDDVLDLSRVAGLSIAAVKWAEMLEEGLELLAEVGFILCLMTLLALHLGRMAGGPVVPPRFHRSAARSLVPYR